jgi:hypothetical protein
MSDIRMMFRLICAVFVAAIALAGTVGSADAALPFSTVGVRDFSAASGEVVRQAGAHSDFEFGFSVPEVEAVREGELIKGPIESIKNTSLDLPPGMYANPQAFASCQPEFLAKPSYPYAECAVAAQIGTATIEIPSGLSEGLHTVALYNVAHGPGVPAKFGFKYEYSSVFITPSVRPGDYGITAASIDSTQAVPIQSVRVRLWGVPADPVHDVERQHNTPEVVGVTIPAESPLVPFFTNPGSCPEAPTPFTASIDSWEDPGVFDTRSLSSDESGAPFLWEGCENLAFQPKIQASPSSVEAGAPSGLKIDFSVPQTEGPYGLASANVRRAVVTLPEGMTVSPSSAAGLGACSEAQVGLGTNDEPTCPDPSKIGSVQIRTPLLGEELEGAMYLARQRENPFGSLLATYLVAKGPGFYLKLPGRIDADSRTGRLTVTFDDTPQLPFEELQVNLRNGPRAPLTVPTSCGTYAIQTEVTPWSGTAPVKGESKFTVNSNCSTGGFKPGFKAGTASPQAGSFSPFNLQVTQASGESNLSKLKATLPPGLLAKLAGVPLCGDAQAASGNCPSGSQVGVTTIGAGPGPSPIYVPEAGKAPTAVYLGGPYKGAPYSLIVKVPAQAGPFDLGTVVVRNALNIDPFTTQVTAESDPLPQILEGIPISYRDVRVEIDKPEFTVNPTNCSQFQIASVLTSASGQSSSPSAPFAAANCEGLGFKPTLKVQLKGATKRTGRPALKAVLTYPSKGSFANIARAQVNLPKALFLEQNNLNKTCTKPVLLAGNCPATSIYGKAKAWSPLLDRPLEGPVYLVGGFGYKLPALVADLDGQIHVLLASKVDSGPNKGLRTTFEAVPDAPVSRFVLEMKGGKKYGLLINSEDLCKGSPQLKAAFTGQNGAVDDFEQKIVAKCGKKSKSKAKPNHKKKGK